jgi:dTDP-4-dehydrorhamnose 3,5-epimerase
MSRAHAPAFETQIIEPEVFTDSRGFFFESYNRRRFEAQVGYPVEFVQDNHSRSRRGVLRGLHYQLPPHPQGKLIRVASGEIYDVTVDIRRGSPTFGQWQAVVLSAENQRQLWVPPGYAHAFMALSESADVLYKTTDYWVKELDRSIRWDDPVLGIAWPAGITPILSEKDAQACAFLDADLFD